MKLIRIFISVSLFYLPVSLWSQNRTISLSQTLEWVRQYHPVAKQAALLQDQARAGLLIAQGAFDPSLFMLQESKTFDGKQYYETWNPEIKIPLWLGAEMKGGLESNRGKFLSTDLTSGQSSYMGISVPVMKDLFFDKRRADLQLSKQMITLSKDQQRLIRNDLIMEATTAYWSWVRNFQNYSNVQQVLGRSYDRFIFIQKMIAHGDRAPMDSLEAKIQWQSLYNQSIQAKLEWMQSTATLSNFLWDSLGQPMQIDTTVLPESSWLFISPTAIPIPEGKKEENTIAPNHPKLKMLDTKISMLEIEKKLKKQSLLPSIKVQYNFLQKGFVMPDPIQSNLFVNNYKAGIHLSVPLLQRQARGALQQATLKIRDQKWERSQMALEISNKIQSYQLELSALIAQIKGQADMEKQYEKLFWMEEEKFNMGESSLFVLNSREVKWIEAQQKTVELRTKLFKALMGLEWAKGLDL